MRRITRLITGVTLFLMALGLLVVATATPINAQQAQVTPAGTCGQVIATIRQSVENKCKNLTGDQVCLGNRPVTVNTKDSTGATASTDIVALDAITSIFTDSLDPAQGVWGMAIVKARLDGENDANQAATFTLYGQASISKAEPNPTAAMPSNLTNLRAFYFSTGSGMQQSCAELPSGGLLIQSQPGKKITFAVNGMDVSLGSSAVLTAPPGVLKLYVLDGQVTVAAKGQTKTAAGGQMFSISLDPNTGLDVAGLPDAPTAIDDNMRKNGLNQGGLCALVQGASVRLAVCGVSAPSVQASPNTPRPTSRPITRAPVVTSSPIPPDTIMPPTAMLPTLTATQVPASPTEPAIPTPLTQVVVSPTPPFSTETGSTPTKTPTNNHPKGCPRTWMPSGLLDPACRKKAGK